ncbi:MAG: glycosyltransferase [Deltaproteobacteria bacterium]|nr:glycosyltransferase [Deltaproteobacteria bacterium]TLN02903.1 MAG: glycosyltransferase [bacterium]
MIPKEITKYLSSRAVKGPWEICGRFQGTFAGAVVIPALAESKNLLATLRSLAQNPPELVSRFLVLVVINNREDTPQTDKDDNRSTLELLAGDGPSLTRLRLAWVDAASPGKELPAKKGGVGLARKIGFDLALPLLDFKGPAPLLVALDADTLVQPDYLSALTGHFRSTAAGGAVLAFHHQEGATPQERQAIRRYELFLRVYVLGLSRAGSPYAFHTIGSAMACTAAAYAGMGGMNTRLAAEDFYFLQHLKKTFGIESVTGTHVLPSARASHRVPFGTGRSISRLLAGEESAVLFYQHECFAILGTWLELVATHFDASGQDIAHQAERISPELKKYLDQAGFVEAWEKLRKNSRDQAALLCAFHSWFDGLRTLKLIHHLSDTRYQRKSPEEVLVPFLHWAGLERLDDPDAQLSLLRSIQSTGS